MCIGPTIRIGRESWCLPYAGFLIDAYPKLSDKSLITLSKNTIASIDSDNIRLEKEIF